jgi:hypothetical protein
MLRICFLQRWFNLSDPAAEEALYDSPALRRFAGVNLGRRACAAFVLVNVYMHRIRLAPMGTKVSGGRSNGAFRTKASTRGRRPSAKSRPRWSASSACRKTAGYAEALQVRLTAFQLRTFLFTRDALVTLVHCTFDIWSTGAAC